MHDFHMNKNVSKERGNNLFQSNRLSNPIEIIEEIQSILQKKGSQTFSKIINRLSISHIKSICRSTFNELKNFSIESSFVSFIYENSNVKTGIEAFSQSSSGTYSDIYNSSDDDIVKERYFSNFLRNEVMESRKIIEKNKNLIGELLNIFLLKIGGDSINVNWQIELNDKEKPSNGIFKQKNSLISSIANSWQNLKPNDNIPDLENKISKIKKRTQSVNDLSQIMTDDVKCLIVIYFIKTVYNYEIAVSNVRNCIGEENSIPYVHWRVKDLIAPYRGIFQDFSISYMKNVMKSHIFNSDFKFIDENNFSLIKINIERGESDALSFMVGEDNYKLNFSVPAKFLYIIISMQKTSINLEKLCMILKNAPTVVINTLYAFNSTFESNLNSSVANYCNYSFFETIVLKYLNEYNMFRTERCTYLSIVKKGDEQSNLKNSKFNRPISITDCIYLQQNQPSRSKCYSYIDNDIKDIFDYSNSKKSFFSAEKPSMDNAVRFNMDRRFSHNGPIDSYKTFNRQKNFMNYDSPLHGIFKTKDKIIHPNNDINKRFSNNSCSETNPNQFYFADNDQFLVHNKFTISDPKISSFHKYSPVCNSHDRYKEKLFMNLKDSIKNSNQNKWIDMFEDTKVIEEKTDNGEKYNLYTFCPIKTNKNVKIGLSDIYYEKYTQKTETNEKPILSNFSKITSCTDNISLRKKSVLGRIKSFSICETNNSFMPGKNSFLELKKKMGCQLPNKLDLNLKKCSTVRDNTDKIVKRFSLKSKRRSVIACSKAHTKQSYGEIYMLKNKWGIIDLGNHEHVYIDRRIFSYIPNININDINMSLVFDITETVYFEAVRADVHKRADWNAIHVWKLDKNRVKFDLTQEYINIKQKRIFQT
ncbi:hypothetical protein A3Q56_01959 [Intoshia linei]|uniref:Uncharacterized protein n=1 Tax=Intoshia linei TaxID=1819745 RepID=A0A177B9H8_9BILA|nr:hypothetical protein A3Q56_01959 [Intoshia linei]